MNVGKLSCRMYLSCRSYPVECTFVNFQKFDGGWGWEEGMERGWEGGKFHILMQQYLNLLK